jgi:hypothetical protein
MECCCQSMTTVNPALSITIKCQLALDARMAFCTRTPQLGGQDAFQHALIDYQLEACMALRPSKKVVVLDHLYV